MRVAKRDDAVAYDQHDDGVGARAALVYGLDGREDLGRFQTVGRVTAELVREDVEQDLGIRSRVQMSAIVVHDELLEVLGVDEVPVVAKTDPVR